MGQRVSKLQKKSRSSFLTIHLVGPLPNDNTEQSRLNMQHIIRLLIDGYHKAPVHETLKRGGARVLKAGCGTGIRSIEIVQKYPKSEFAGADLIAPLDVKFDIANILNLPSV